MSDVRPVVTTVTQIRPVVVNRGPKGEDGSVGGDLTGEIAARIAGDAANAAAIAAEAATRAAADATLPTAGEKAALPGTSGSPGSGNKYVTDADARNSNARAPTAHTHPISDVTGLQGALDLKAPLLNPDFTPGVPLVSTAAPGTSTAQAASTAFVAAAVTAAVALILGSAPPAALDTLKELADAINDDASFAASVTTALAGKQPLDTDLTAIAALTSAANKLAYATGAGTWALTDLVAFGRTLIACADASAGRTALGVVIGTDVAAQGDSRFPSAGEKSALAGTSGTPGSGNKYVTNDDTRNSDQRTPTDGSVTTVKIGDAQVTDAKLADMPAATVKGRALGAGTGVPVNLTAAQLRTLAALVIGTDVQAWSARLDVLAAFTGIADGQFVKRNGSTYDGGAGGTGGDETARILMLN